MKLKVKLSLTIILLITVIIAVLSFVTLNRSGSLLNEAAYDKAMEIAIAYEETLGNRFESYIRPAMTVAQIFGEYHNIDLYQRRDMFDSILNSLMVFNDDFTGVWTAWLPNAMDGRSAELGQYHPAYTRRDGPIERMADGFEGWQGYLDTLMASKEMAAVSGPVWRTVGNQEQGVITVTYKILNSVTKQPVGIVGINYVTKMQSFAEEISKAIYEGKGLAGFYNQYGITVAHTDKTRVKKNLKDNPQETGPLGNHLDKVMNLIQNGGDPLTLHIHSQTLGTDVYQIYYPVEVLDTGVTYTLVLGLPMNEVTKSVRDMTIFSIIFAIVAIVIAAIVAFVLAVQISKPIIKMSLTLKDISEGEGDLTKVIEVNGKDETADMGHYFNLTLKKIRELVFTIKQRSVALNDIGNELAASMNETAAAINQITSNIQSIKGRVINQSTSVTETNATMESITDNINKLNAYVENQTQSVSQSSSAVEEMLANIQSVTGTLVKNGENVNELTEASEVGKTGLQEVAADIQAISRESEGLLEINSVMENIASQTNLLSMNAAIEAAHAGEAGKGFAVVADEIRKLAESSSEQSKTIGSVLKKIKESIDKISKSTDNVLQRFGAIDEAVKTVADQEENIRNAMEEQGTGSKQILDAIGQLHDITQQVKNGSLEMLEGSKEVIKEGGNLERVTEEITGGMNEMATGAEQINLAVNQVNDQSMKNQENIDLLLKEVSRFKVD